MKRCEDVVEHLSRDDLEVAMLTHVRGGRKEEGEVEADERGGPSEQHELTKEMFDLSARTLALRPCGARPRIGLLRGPC